MNQSILRRVTACVVVLICVTSSGFSDDEQPEQKPTAFNVVFAHDPGKGNYDGVVGKPNDDWNFATAGTRKVKQLKAANGKTTAVNLELSENDGAWGIKKQAGIFHGYIYHNCRCVDLQATFTGLPKGHYKIYVFAHGDAPNQNAMIELAVGPEVYGRRATLADGSWKFQSTDYKEGVQYISLEFIVTDNEPVTITSHRSGSNYSMLNAIQIVPVVKK